MSDDARAISQLIGLHFKSGNFDESKHPRASAGNADGGQFVSAGGGTSGGGNMPERVPTPKGSETVWFHGTSNRQRTMGGDAVYLTDSEDEAYQYSRDVHRLGGPAGNQRRTLTVAVKPGRTLNLDNQLQSAMANGEDPDAFIRSQIPKARKQGYGYIFFRHPSNLRGNQGLQNVLVSLNPKRDLNVK